MSDYELTPKGLLAAKMKDGAEAQRVMDWLKAHALKALKPVGKEMPVIVFPKTGEPYFSIAEDDGEPRRDA